MGKRHLALVVEDHAATAEDYREILDSAGCDSVVFDNKTEALDALRSRTFCLVLLDLGIRGVPGAIKSHQEHGRSLLRELRNMHSEHKGTSYLLPVLIVSGITWDAVEAVAVMRDGADDVIQKTAMKTRDLSEAVREALERSGRSSHDACGAIGKGVADQAGDRITLSVPGNRAGRRVQVMVGGKEVALTETTLTLLLRLMVAQAKGDAVHKDDMGASG